MAAAIEHMGPVEISGLALHEQTEALGELIHVTFELGRAIAAANTLHAELRYAALRDPTPDTKGAVFVQKAVLDNLNVRRSILKQVGSYLQTTMKTQMTVG